MYYNPSPTQENPMNLLISPFVPNQQEDEPFQLQNGSDNNQLNFNSQPLDVPMQQFGIAMNNQSPMDNQLPSPQFDMMNNYEFISHSPESSSSNDSNIVSPPQQYHPSDFASSQYNPSVKRSASVPPHFHKFKSHQQDSMYNQFQVNHHMPNKKALPMKISRVNGTHHQLKYPINSEAQRHQLDEKLEKVNFDDVTVAELKEMLRERGLSATGRKAELLTRLKGEYELLKKGSPLHRRVANLNILDSPTKRHHQRLYLPYSPPTHHTRLASSVPDSNTQSFLNDQYMMMKKPSCLRKSIDKEEPSFPNTEDNVMDIWDDQTLQNFLNQI